MLSAHNYDCDSIKLKQTHWFALLLSPFLWLQFARLHECKQQTKIHNLLAIQTSHTLPSTHNGYAWISQIRFIYYTSFLHNDLRWDFFYTKFISVGFVVHKLCWAWNSAEGQRKFWVLNMHLIINSHVATCNKHLFLGIRPKGQ